MECVNWFCGNRMVIPRTFTLCEVLDGSLKISYLGSIVFPKTTFVNVMCDCEGHFFKIREPLPNVKVLWTLLVPHGVLLSDGIEGP